MAIILPSVFLTVLANVRAVRSQAQTLQGLPSSFPFDSLRGPLDQMGLAIVPVQEFLATYPNATAVQTAAERVILAGAPANIRGLIAAVDTAHGAFSTAYAAIYAGAGNLVSYSTATRRHGSVTISASALSSLAAPLAALVSACAALDYEG